MLPRTFTLTVAFLWFILGIDAAKVPYFPYAIWPITFTLIAAGIVHATFRPDRYKLRLITALAAASGVTRGLAYSLQTHRPGPTAAWLLIAMLSVAYYLARRDWLPEHYHDDDYS